jgi:hypothetical protein
VENDGFNPFHKRISQQHPSLSGDVRGFKMSAGGEDLKGFDFLDKCPFTSPKLIMKLYTLKFNL